MTEQKKSYLELLEARKQLTAKIEEARANERAQAVTTIKQLMADFNVSLEELAGKPQSRRNGPQAPKYRNPETGSTWSGRGKAPAWIAGKDRTQFAI